MNIFKTLNGMVWGNNDSQELVAINSGQFYVIGLDMQRSCRYSKLLCLFLMHVQNG